MAPIRSHEEVRGALARPLTKLVHTDFCSRRCDTAGGRRSATTADSLPACAGASAQQGGVARAGDGSPGRLPALACTQDRSGIATPA